jgi:hypothetical protein
MFFSLDAVEGRKYVVASERQERKKKLSAKSKILLIRGKSNPRSKKTILKLFYPRSFLHTFYE